MRVFENPAAAAELIRRANAYQASLHPRAEGLHVSDLVYCRRKAWYRRQARANGLPAEEHDTDTLTLFLLGHGYHALLEQGVAERTLRLLVAPTGGQGAPGGEPIVVHGTVDYLEPGNVPHEFKTTRASAAKPLDEVQHYIEQVASYCLGLGVQEGRLSVIHINGSYNKDGAGMKPTIRTYDLEFSPDDLTRWAAELRRRVGHLLAPTPPPLPCHRTWECRYCPFATKRGGPCPGGPGDPTHFFLTDELPGFVTEVLDA